MDNNEKLIQQYMIECFVKTSKVIPKPKLSSLQNTLKSKEINSIISTTKNLYA